jgi:hypothetical protein
MLGGIPPVGGAEEGRIEEGCLMIDHVYMLRILPKMRGVAGGRLHQGKGAIHLAGCMGERKRSFVGQHLHPPQNA